MCSTSNLSDEEVAEKFKREHFEQFQVLVRMHLSFLLHMTMEENESFYDKNKQFQKKWHLIPFGKKLKTHSTSTIDGAPLTQEGICQIYQLIEFLKNEQNISTEGIFRKTGSVERQTDLKNQLIQGVTLELEQGRYSVHDCSSVLKSFLAGLPEPLLTDTHFPVYCQILETCSVGNGALDVPQDHTKFLESLQLLLLLLPNDNRALLKDILELLYLVTTFEESNKMSAENLAKLFTPHLLCPRKMSPETLLKDAQSFFSIISFMIKNYSVLFKTPSKLVLEFRAYYEKKKISSPSNKNNESINDAVSTVFTFVDKERTLKENLENPTETALAQLYAHIQSLPESSKKRKLVKQFNKENGNGTPLQVVRSSATKTSSKGFTDSLKKRVFSNKLGKKGVKKFQLEQKNALIEGTLNSPCTSQQHEKTRLFCYNFSNSEDISAEYDERSKKPKFDPNNVASCDQNAACEHALTHEPCTCDAGVKQSVAACERGLTHNTSLYSNYATSMTCLTSSTPTCVRTSASLRACAKAAFTPVDEQEPKSMSPITRSTQRMPKAMQETMMTPRSRKPVLLVSGTNINNLPKIDQRNLLMLDNLTEENSTSSTIFEEEEHVTNQRYLFKKSKSEGDISGVNIHSDSNTQTNLTDTPEALKSTFIEYLHSRNIQPFFTPPVDSSFSSRTDDFKSADEILNLSENQMSKSLLQCLNQSKNADVSLENENNSELVFLGNVPEDSCEKRLVLKPKQFNEDGKPIVFETSF